MGLAQNTIWALVQRICHVQDIFIREPLYGHALWDEIPQQAIVVFVLSPLPRAVRMCKVQSWCRDSQTVTSSQTQDRYRPSSS